MAVPYTFGNATTSIPLSQLDSNFATAITIGNTSVQLGNTITNLTGVTNIASASSLTVGSNGNTTAIYVDTSQNVGIGTTSPVTKLQVINSLAITNSGGTQYLLMGNQDSGGTNKPNMIVSSNANLQFGVGSSWSSNVGGTFTEYMRIDSSGNVGIGTTSPSTKLSVNGTAALLSGNALQFSNSSNTGSGKILCSGGGTLSLYSYTSEMLTLYEDSAIEFKVGSGTERMRIDSSGNLLVGTTSTPTSAVSVLAMGNATAPSASITGGIIYVSSGALYFRGSSGTVTKIANA